MVINDTNLTFDRDRELFFLTVNFFRIFVNDEKPEK